MTMTACRHDLAVAGTAAHSRGSRAGLMLALLLLTGCPGTQTADQPLQVQTAAAVAVPPVPKPKPAPRPASANAAAARKLADAAPVAQTQLAALPPSVTPGEMVDPSALMGLDQDQTRRLLGSPASTEDAPPSKVWRYAKGDCTLKVFFFMDMTSSQDFRALSYDMKSSDNVPDADSRCFAQILAQAWDHSHD